MPKMNVVRATSIKSSPDKVFHALSDLHSWTTWSPWLIMEPEAKVDVSEDGKYYEWKGKRVGSGNMKITGEKKNESVYYDLTFLEPWKSEAKVTFDVIPKGEECQVHWTMNSSLPWFMFWMKSMMEGFVAMDFDRGLNMLKDFIEKGHIDSKMQFKGYSDFTETPYIGIKTTCKMVDIGEVMKADFEKLGDYFDAHPDLHGGSGYAIYHKWNIRRKETTYTACFALDSVPDDLPSGFFKGKIPASKVYTIRHIGPYRHLGNAWSTLMSMERNKEFKKNKRMDPFEEYISDPRETEENDLITDIHFGVK